MFKIYLQLKDTCLFQSLSLSIINENLSKLDFSDIFNQSGLSFNTNEEALFNTDEH